jgi:tetratricopeptide (TPR) repeat protein
VTIFSANTNRVAAVVLLATALSDCSHRVDPAALAGAQAALHAAQAALAGKNLDEAIPLLTAAIESGVLPPEDAARALVDRATCLARVDMFDLAHADLDAAANAAPPDEVHAARSFVFAEEGKAAEAEGEFEKARLVNPSVERIRD